MIDSPVYMIGSRLGKPVIPERALVTLYKSRVLFAWNNFRTDGHEQKNQ